MVAAAPLTAVGDWRINGDELVQEQLGKASRVIIFGDPSWSEYDFSFQAQSVGGSHGFKAILQAQNPQTFREFSAGNYSNTAYDLEATYRGKWSRGPGMHRNGQIAFNRWYDVRIEVRGPEVACYVDGKRFFRERDQRFTHGRVGLATYDAKARFRNIRVTTPDGATLWEGLPNVGTRLASRGPTTAPAAAAHAPKPPSRATTFGPPGTNYSKPTANAPAGKAATPPSRPREEPAPQAPPSNSLFHGSDLTGWEGLPGYWQVRDGALVGAPVDDSQTKAFLCSKRAYRDFELSFNVRRKNGVGRSGLQFRSQLADLRKFVVVGPKVEIGPAEGDYPPGTVFLEPAGFPCYPPNRPRIAALWKESGFNHLRVKCVGNRVQVDINGVSAIDVEYRDIPDNGIIAWQLHGNTAPEEVTLKDVVLTDLSPERTLAATAAGAATPAAILAAPTVKSADGFIALFNGRELFGLRTPPQAPSPEVRSGVAVLSASNTFLVTTDAKHKDGVLRLQLAATKGTEAFVGCAWSTEGTIGKE